MVDDCTRYRWFRPLKKKSQALKEVKSFIPAFRNAYGVTVSKFRSDGGGEFVAMKPYFEEEGIQWETSVPDNQSQNGVSERSIRTVVEKARCHERHRVKSYGCGLTRIDCLRKKGVYLTVLI